MIVENIVFNLENLWFFSLWYWDEFFFFSDFDDMWSSMIEVYNFLCIINKSLIGYDWKVRLNVGGFLVIVKIEFKVILFGEIKEVNMVSFGIERYYL